MFGTIAAAGVRIISREVLDRRALMIFSFKRCNVKVES
jgi:xanthine/uracil permease